MIINYDIETGKIVTTSYGMDEPWTDEDTVAFNTQNEEAGIAAAKLDDADTTRAYYDVSSSSLKAISDFEDLSASKDELISNGTDYIEFTNIPEGTKIYVDHSLIGEMDSSGIYRFSCSDAGSYHLLMKKLGYNWFYKEVIANDNFE